MSTQPAPDDVRHHYAQAAQAAADGTAACCDDDRANFGAHLYDSLDDVPDSAVLASIGCGNPTAVADLQPGDHVSPPAARIRRRDHLRLRHQPLTDKAAVFAEMHGVLRPGGRIGVSDVVADDGLTQAQRAERGTHFGARSFA